MTKQETFDLIVNHLRKQGRPSKGPFSKNSTSDWCLLRGPDGLSCAVGCLIPDELYSAQFEGPSLSNSPELQQILKGLGHDVELCCALQSVHDRYPTDLWESALRQVAPAFGVEYTNAS